MKVVLAFGSVAGIALIILLGYFEKRYLLGMPLYKLTKSTDAVGWKPRTEREFKFEIRPMEKGAPISSLGKILRRQLTLAVKNEDHWNAPGYFKGSYYLTHASKPFVFRDIYFDTKDGLTQKHDISYRLRYRWKDIYAYNNYIAGARNRTSLPVRAEIQAKVGRRNLGDGLSEVQESRLEFKDGSPPFDEFFMAPRPPYRLTDLISSVRTGKYEGKWIAPAKSLALYLKEIGVEQKMIILHPTLIVQTLRNRFHFNLPTPFGSGANPNNAFIVTLDTFTVVDANDFDFEREKFKVNTEILARNIEIEIEFERNISRGLDEELKLAQKNKNIQRIQELRKQLDAFLLDQKNIVGLAASILERAQFRMIPEDRSKYAQASRYIAADG